MSKFVAGKISEWIDEAALFVKPLQALKIKEQK